MNVECVLEAKEYKLQQQRAWQSTLKLTHTKPTCKGTNPRTCTEVGEQGVSDDERRMYIQIVLQSSYLGKNDLEI